MKKKLMLRTVILCAINISLISITTRAQEKITLAIAIQRALSNNITLKQSKINESLSIIEINQAKNNLLPNLNASTVGGYNFGRSQAAGTFAYTSSTSINVNGNAQLQITLFQGGALRNQIIQNKLLLDISKSQTTKLKNDLTLNVLMIYLQILTDQDLVAAAKQQLEITNQTLQKLIIGQEVGSQSLADVSQAKAQVSAATLNLTTSQSQLDLSMLTLLQYMEMDPYTPIAIERPDITKDAEVKTFYDAKEVIKTTLMVNPDMLLAELQQKTYQQAIRIAKSGYYPTVTLFSGIASSYSNTIREHVVAATPVEQQIGTTVFSGEPVVATSQQPVYAHYPTFRQIGDNLNQNIGLSIEIPIFSRFNNNSSVSKAKLNLQNAQLNTLSVKNNLSKTVIQAILDLDVADKRYKSAQQNFETNKVALDNIKQRYEVGLINLVDYNVAITNFDKAQNDFIEARYAVIFRSKIIDYYQGNAIKF
jgi:outer membrane protein